MRNKFYYYLLMAIVISLSFTQCEKVSDEPLNLKKESNQSFNRKSATTFKARINGQLFNFNEHKPIQSTQNQRALLPAQQILSWCGFTMESTGNTYVFRKANTKISFIVNNMELESNYSGSSNTYTMNEVACLVNNKLYVPYYALGDYLKEIKTDWDENTKTVNITYWDEPYIGISWLGMAGETFNNYQKYNPGEYNPYYNPNKPTVIVIHGWESDAVKKEWHHDLLLEVPEKGIYEWTHNYWIEKGWNVGLFHWTQYADELFVWDAESKIWDGTYGDQKMQWKNSRGQYITDNMISESVGDILFNQFSSALVGQNPNAEIRIVGHSLGTQLATRLSREVFEEFGNGAPCSVDRLVLIEPAAGWQDESFLQSFNALYNGENTSCSTAEIVASFAQTLADNDLPIEYYRSSALMLAPTAEANKPLQKLASFVELKPWYTWDQAKKHNWPLNTYFWSINFSGKNGVPNWWSNQRYGVSANAPDWRIKECMNAKYKYVQVRGKNTETPADDFFEVYRY